MSSEAAGARLPWFLLHLLIQCIQPCRCCACCAGEAARPDERVDLEAAAGGGGQEKQETDRNMVEMYDLLKAHLKGGGRCGVGDNAHSLAAHAAAWVG